MAEKKPWRDFIPTAPTVDFAYLKACWPEVARRRPHVQAQKRPMPTFRIIMPLEDDGIIIVKKDIKAMTKSEARSVVKKELGLERLPVGAMVARMP